MKIRFTESDIKQNTIVDTNWYQVQITEFDEKKSKKGDWTNCYINTVISSDNPKFNGVPVLKVIAEMMKAEYMKLCAALSGEEEISTEADYNLSKAIVGQKLLAFIKPGPDQNGVVRNQLENWAPLSYLDTIQSTGGELG